ncbi:protein of unknown function [Vibrio tapetis subsp. tapetis]|uniref:Uncharacterized protein n=1 Tax=Vibrio tapetis subsp. tapetis TaxID=1671868 RepID=A0A2N8ZEQ8_9VIBR|nr:protein of unknown function [Vibrio tapetis subsp. tapetis]
MDLKADRMSIICYDFIAIKKEYHYCSHAVSGMLFGSERNQLRSISD